MEWGLTMIELDTISHIIRWKEKDINAVRFSDYEIIQALDEVLRYISQHLANMQSDLVERSIAYEDSAGDMETLGAVLPGDFLSIQAVYKDGDRRCRMHAVSSGELGEDDFRLSNGRIYVKGSVVLCYYGSIPPVRMDTTQIDLPKAFTDVLVKLTRTVLNNGDVDAMTQAVASELESIIPRRKYNHMRVKVPFYV